MKFHKLNPPATTQPKVPPVDTGICWICNTKPIAGYVLGSGQYLSRSCLQCYRSAGIDSYERMLRTHGAHKQSRS
ncbi:MAG: hypothetical protein WCR46_01265 [Deltaproteobacteria bacterium]